MNKSKTVSRDTRDHSEYNGFKISQTLVDVTRFKEINGQRIVVGGTQRFEWEATDGLTVLTAKTLKSLKQQIEGVA